MVLSDHSIREEITAGRIVIDPFVPSNIQPSSVDLRLGKDFRVFEYSSHPFIDPMAKGVDYTKHLVVDSDGSFVLHPGEFALGTTFERIALPDNIVGRLEGKSTLGRLGLMIHSTAGYVDPGWDGFLTLELANVANIPIILHPGMRIGQISFTYMSTPVDVPYGSPSLGSHYQGQVGATPSGLLDD
ncbi:MAG: dCTP deaminase [Coriobacteriales bacterium]|jgi:dCTP deaminase